MKKIPIPDRHRFPDDEKRLSWLPLLLDAYAVVDEGISAAVRKREREQAAALACGQGCNVCCRVLKDIPVYPLELVGIYWFAIEKIAGPDRALLKKQFLNHARWAACPFLLHGLCSLHPLRPMACRQFNVFNKRCEEGEDPYHTRRGDVLTPIEEYVHQAFFITLPFYGVTDESNKAHVIKNNLIHTHARVLQSLPWHELAARMDDFDFKHR
ncbi:MAG: YkgJ family cysteine cluster protein [Nitrospirota bacterium]